MSIAEIIAEGKRLEAAYDSAVKRELDSEAHALWDERCAFWDEHGPRLLAVAEAAVACVDDPFDTGAFERLRAAVRGEDE